MVGVRAIVCCLPGVVTDALAGRSAARRSRRARLASQAVDRVRVGRPDRRRRGARRARRAGKSLLLAGRRCGRRSMSARRSVRRRAGRDVRQGFCRYSASLLASYAASAAGSPRVSPRSSTATTSSSCPEAPRRWFRPSLTPETLDLTGRSRGSPGHETCRGARRRAERPPGARHHVHDVEGRRPLTAADLLLERCRDPGRERRRPRRGGPAAWPGSTRPLRLTGAPRRHGQRPAHRRGTPARSARSSTDERGRTASRSPEAGPARCHR